MLARTFYQFLDFKASRKFAAVELPGSRPSQQRLRGCDHEKENNRDEGNQRGSIQCMGILH
jgi:hypothetical protein